MYVFEELVALPLTSKADKTALSFPSWILRTCFRPESKSLPSLGLYHFQLFIGWEQPTVFLRFASTSRNMTISDAHKRGDGWYHSTQCPAHDTGPPLPFSHVGARKKGPRP